MGTGKYFSNRNLRMVKIVIGGAVLVGLGVGRMLLNIKPKKLDVVDQVDLEKFSGLWYEIARKAYFEERRSYKSISVDYRLIAADKFDAERRYYSEAGRLYRVAGIVHIENPPSNSKFSVSFAKSHLLQKIKQNPHWLMRIDDDYQVALFGDPKRKHLWLMSRTPHVDRHIIDDYLNYAEQQDFSLKDLIYVKHDV